jgi:hypothetical protein
MENEIEKPSIDGPAEEDPEIDLLQIIGMTALFIMVGVFLFFVVTHLLGAIHR